MPSELRHLTDDDPQGEGASAAYATFSEYQARVPRVDDGARERTQGQILAISRWVDRKLGVMPGGFAPIASATYLFDGTGGDKLWLRDGEGAWYPLRSVADDGIRPDFERTGLYDGAYAWDLDDRFLWPIPRNGPAIGRPYRALELRRIGDAPVTIWPYEDGSVQIAGAWGWEQTPEPIREFVVARTHDIIDAVRGGAAASVAPGEDELSFSDDSWRIWNSIQAEYNFKRNRAVAFA